MIAKVFIEDKLIQKIKEDPMCMAPAGIRNKSVLIDLDGSGGGQWLFDFDSNGALKLGPPQQSSSCSIWMKDSTFEKMIEGDLNVPLAFMMRKIKVSGEINLAADLGIALQKIFSKNR